MPPPTAMLKTLWLPLLLVGGLLVFFATGTHHAVSWQGIARNYAGITGFADENLPVAALGLSLIHI